MSNGSKRIAIIFGTRPEAIKLAPVIYKLREYEEICPIVGVTAQHRHLLDQVLYIFNIRPDFDLNLMTPGQQLAAFSSAAIKKLDNVFAEQKPDLVIVQGDTSTVFCAALVAFYRHIPVAHVEAGLRTGNLQSPWPEEGNRVLTTRITDLHFAPTATSRENLLREGIEDNKIFVTGNTVIDSLFMALSYLDTLDGNILGLPKFLNTISAEKRIVLITGHRRENFGEGIRNILRAIRELADLWPEVDFIYPIHPNPQVENAVKDIFPETRQRLDPFTNIHFIEPLAYLPFVALMRRSYLILTDSGGIQEEAPSLGKPVLVTRDTTERPEAIEAGTVQLIGTEKTKIVFAVSQLLTNSSLYMKMANKKNPYGDGHAAKRIADTCVNFLFGCE
jgi:UDP-N-acetylglucosamine 2-epimerase (non-hydrolysing)